MNILNVLLFIALPYVAIVICVVGLVYRYRQKKDSISSLSSQFLESKVLFWGVVPFHFGILVTFLGHCLAFLTPQAQLAWNGNPVRLIILEVTAFIFALSVLIGLVLLMGRRFTNARLKVVTSPMDVFVEFVLLAQVILGIWIALGYRWGSSWFATDLSPYLWSLLAFRPSIEAVGAMPWVIKFHIAGAFLLLFLVPFSRLAHMLVVPIHYIWRPYQQVIWNWDRKQIRMPDTTWSKHRPMNN